MDKRQLRTIACGVGLSFLLAVSQAAGGQTVTAVPKLDLEKFSGVWFEIARYPEKKEKRCVGNGVMLFALGDKTNHVQLVNSCKNKAGYTDATIADGKAENKSGDGRLKLGLFWPLYRKYWVLAVGPEEDWSLVGSPNHKDLWIYSRTLSMKPEVLAEIEAKATAQGFSMAKLVMVPQTAR